MTTAHMRPMAERDYGLDIIEPKQWPFDDGERREPVIDRNWNDRVVRHAGWRTCMHCQEWFFSSDVRRIRLHEKCGQPDHDLY